MSERSFTQRFDDSTSFSSGERIKIDNKHYFIGTEVYPRKS